MVGGLISYRSKGFGAKAYPVDGPSLTTGRPDQPRHPHTPPRYRAPDHQGPDPVVLHCVHLPSISLGLAEMELVLPLVSLLEWEVDREEHPEHGDTLPSGPCGVVRGFVAGIGCYQSLRSLVRMFHTTVYPP